MKRNAETSPSYSSPRQFVHEFRQLIEVVDDRREFQRIPKRVTVSIQPLDEDFAPEGEPFWAISSDVSQLGMGIVCDDRIFHEYIRLVLVDQEVSVIAKVRHSTSIGTQYPLFLIGVEFLDEYLV